MPSKRLLIAMFVLGAAALLLIPKAFTQASWPAAKNSASPASHPVTVPEKSGNPNRLQIGDLQIESGSLSEFRPEKT